MSLGAFIPCQLDKGIISFFFFQAYSLLYQVSFQSRHAATWVLMLFAISARNWAEYVSRRPHTLLWRALLFCCFLVLANLVMIFISFFFFLFFLRLVFPVVSPAVLLYRCQPYKQSLQVTVLVSDFWLPARFSWGLWEQLVCQCKQPDWNQGSLA